MKRLVKCLICSLFIGTFPALPFVSMASDLIEPTRTLESSSEQPAKLSVFSEPPELLVTLDGSAIGKTPVLEREVKPGLHVIRIKDSETEIDVKPGQPVQFSWIKGSFIKIPSAPEGGSPAQPAEKEKVLPKAESEKPEEKKDELRPLYWPLDPKGPIY